MLIFIAILALVQATLGVFRAFQWFNVGADLLGRDYWCCRSLSYRFCTRSVGDPRGDALCAVCRRPTLQTSWVWWLDLSVAAINVLLVLNAVIQGESVSRAGFWLIAPIIIAAYLLSPSGRAAATRRTGVNS
jgi:hypothetical protein